MKNIRDVVRATQGSEWFTVIDPKEEFYHIEIETRNKQKTAFEFNGQIYEWNSMITRLKNAPQIMQRMINQILSEIRNKGVKFYMNDIIIHADTKEKHYDRLRRVLEKLRKYRMLVNKCEIQFCEKEVKLLGVKVDREKQTLEKIKKNKVLE